MAMEERLREREGFKTRAVNQIIKRRRGEARVSGGG